MKANVAFSNRMANKKFGTNQIHNCRPKICDITVKYRESSQMVWGCTVSSGVGKWGLIDRKLYKHVYFDILKQI